MQTPGFQNFPTYFATDMSASPPNLYVWAPASGSYPLTVGYYKQMDDITSPETSTTVPWFPHSTYLVRRTAGELMLVTGDDRAAAFLTDNEQESSLGAGVLLRKYLRMDGDKNSRALTVTLDRRRFGTPFSSLRDTNQIGW